LKINRPRFTPWTIALVCLTFILSVSSFTACEEQEKIIKIGSQASYTGDGSEYGYDQLNSLMIAAQELSPVEIGGFEYKISIIPKDDEGNVEKSFLISQELVDEDVAAVVGSTFNGTTKAAIPNYAEFDIPLLSPSAQSVDIALGTNNFFRMIINNKQKIENIAFFLKDEIDPESLVLIDNREEYSINLIDFLIEVFDDIGFEYLKRYSIQAGKEDMEVMAENLFIDNPDTIFFCAGPKDLADLMSNTRELGLESTFITEQMGMAGDISIFAEEEDIEGLVAIVYQPPSLARYSEDESAIAFWQKYMDYLEESDPEGGLTGPGEYAPYSYDALNVIIEAMKKANSIIPAEFIDELRDTSYEGTTGLVSFDSNGDRQDPESTVFVMKNNNWVRY